MRLLTHLALVSLLHGICPWLTPRARAAETAAAPPEADSPARILAPVGSGEAPVALGETSVGTLHVIRTHPRVIEAVPMPVSAAARRVESPEGAPVVLGIIPDETARESIEGTVAGLAARVGGWPRGVEIALRFEHDFLPADGAAVGLPAALVLASMIEGIALDPGFASAGGIDEALATRRVGAMPLRLGAAARAGVALFAIPTGNADAAWDMVVGGRAADLARVQVFQVDTLDAALALARRDRAGELADALDAFRAFQAVVAAHGGDVVRALATSESLAALERTLRLAPDHLSAQVLLEAGRGRARSTLTLATSLLEIEAAAGPFLRLLKGEAGFIGRPLDGITYGASVQRLGAVRARLDPRAVPLCDALPAYIEAWRRAAQEVPPGAGRTGPALERLIIATDTLRPEAEALYNDPELLCEPGL